MWRMLNHNQHPTSEQVLKLEKVLKEKTDYKIEYINRQLNTYKAGVYANTKGDR